MVARRVLAILCVATSLIATQSAAAATTQEPQTLEAGSAAVVFGSFSAEANANRWAEEVARRLTTVVGVERVESGLYRVKTQPLPAQDASRLLRLARERGLDAWRLRQERQSVASAIEAARTDESERSDSETFVAELPKVVGGDEPRAPSRAVAADSPSESKTQPDEPGESIARPTNPPVTSAPSTARFTSPTAEWSHELRLENRVFRHSGASGQARWAPAMSIESTLYAASNDDRWSFTATPYLRLDAEDSRRNRGDLREFFVSRVSDRWEAHLGAREVFWGVTEFSHLVDVINQTDLVENVDGEDKLGQPMLSVSRVTDWGIVDLYALLGARERTFPGMDGRLRTLAPVASSRASFDSGAGRERVDGAIRWTHFLGPAEVGIYHFSGTSREPILEPVFADGAWVLAPRYTTIDQSGLDAQYLLGDTALKLEAIRRSGFGDTYVAANLGLEHTLVGAFGGRSDLGLVLEYLWDERGDEAFNTVFERDIAIGSRWQFNDAADSHALVGVIWDPSSDETQFSLEAGRRLGDLWSLNLEARVFSGDAPDENDVLGSLLDPDRKLSSITQDDYMQLEVVRYF